MKTRLMSANQVRKKSLIARPIPCRNSDQSMSNTDIELSKYQSPLSTYATNKTTLNFNFTRHLIDTRYDSGKDVAHSFVSTRKYPMQNGKINNIRANSAIQSEPARNTFFSSGNSSLAKFDYVSPVAAVNFKLFDLQRLE